MFWHDISAMLLQEPETRRGSGGVVPSSAYPRIEVTRRNLRQQRFEKIYKILIKPAVTEFTFTFFHLLLAIMLGAGPNLTGKGPFSLSAAALSTGLNLYAFISSTFDIRYNYFRHHAELVTYTFMYL